MWEPSHIIKHYKQRMTSKYVSTNLKSKAISNTHLGMNMALDKFNKAFDVLFRTLKGSKKKENSVRKEIA